MRRLLIAIISLGALASATLVWSHFRKASANAWTAIPDTALAEEAPNWPRVRVISNLGAHTLTFLPEVGRAASKNQLILARKVSIDPYPASLDDFRIYATNTLPPELANLKLWEKVISTPPLSGLRGALYGSGYYAGQNLDPPIKIAGLLIQNSVLGGFVAADAVTIDENGFYRARLKLTKCDPIGLTVPSNLTTIDSGRPIESINDANVREYVFSESSYRSCTSLTVPDSFRYYLLSTAQTRYSFHQALRTLPLKPFGSRKQEPLFHGKGDACMIYTNPAVGP